MSGTRSGPSWRWAYCGTVQMLQSNRSVAALVGMHATSRVTTSPAATSRPRSGRHRTRTWASATSPIAARMSPGWLDTIHIRCGRRASSSGQVGW